MATIDNKKIELVKELYYKKFYPMSKIAKTIGVSIDAVVYFMRVNNLKRRTLKEDNLIRFKNKPLSYNIRKNLNKKQEILKIIAVTLYWGEGYKTEKSHTVDLANSDVSMILVFLKFLREVCRVDEKRIRVLLYCYSNQNPKKLVEFWSNITKISQNQFTKPYVRKDFNIKMIGKMPYGMVHLRYADKKLLAVIKSWIEEYKGICVGTQAVNEGKL